MIFELSNAEAALVLDLCDAEQAALDYLCRRAPQLDPDPQRERVLGLKRRVREAVAGAAAAAKPSAEPEAEATSSTA